MTATTSRRPSPTFHLIAYPWDFPAEDRSGTNVQMEETLDRLRGEVGLSGLALWGATPPVRDFRIRDIRPRLHQCDGALQFEPLKYQGGCRPRPTISSTNLVPTIAQACERCDLSLRLLVATASMGGLAQHYPEFATQNAFGDPSRISVCLLHPAVRECIVGLVANIPPQFAVGQVTLSDFRVGWFEAENRSIHWPGAVGVVERAALGVCFCPACAAAARDMGVDADDARALVRNLIQKTFAQGTAVGGTTAGFLAENKPLASYVGVQSHGLNKLLEQMASASRAEIMVMSDEAITFLESPGTQVAGMTTIVRAASPPWRHAPTTGRPMELTVPAQFLLPAHAEGFVAAMSELGERGYSGIQVDRLGDLPDAAFATLKQAIRFARRSAVL